MQRIIFVVFFIFVLLILLIENAKIETLMLFCIFESYQLQKKYAHTRMQTNAKPCN